MSDIFREVQDDIRRERFAQLWKKYGDYVIAAVALLIIGAAAFQIWRIYERRQSNKASETMFAGEQLLESGQADEAASVFAKLAGHAPGGYGTLARLEEADALLEGGNTPDAIALYKQVAAQGGPVLSPVARLRAGWAMVEQAPVAETEAVLKPLTSTPNPWRPMAREIVAFAEYRTGAYDAALATYRSIAADSHAPPALRERSSAMAVLLAAGGDRDFGTVPPPPKADSSAPASAQGAKAP